MTSAKPLLGQHIQMAIDALSAFQGLGQDKVDKAVKHLEDAQRTIQHVRCNLQANLDQM